MKKPRVRLENYAVLHARSLQMTALQRGTFLSGHVYGHPKFPDGTHVYTSCIQRVNKKSVTTYNTCYILGNLNKVYQSWLEENSSVKNESGAVL